jgi:hypothetical protein
MSTRPIIEKWYKKLRFPQEFDAEFYEALETIPVPADTTLAGYDKKTGDGRRNLLTYLYLCEGVWQKAVEKGIPEEIMVDTLYDIVRWCKVWTKQKGYLYLGELGWLDLHMNFTLFKLGRLQFRMCGCIREVPEFGIAKGTPILEIHIPAGEKLDTAKVLASLEQAKSFFAEYFPAYHYDYFTCSSWLLDEDLRDYLPESSNILRFGDLFTRVYAKEFNCLLSSVFENDTTEENLASAVPKSAFAQRVKDAVLGGKRFHMTFGILPK